MRNSPELLFCGPESIELRSILTRKFKKIPQSWFNSKRIEFLYKARVGIRLACEILGIGHGDEVLVPSYNCGTEIDAICASGASISLYRVKKDGYIDCDDLRGRITPNTKLIFVTHYFGFPQRLEQVLKICRNYELFLLEDCALSLFSSDNSYKLGTVGDVAVFSFPKTLPVPDGAIIQINNPVFSLEGNQLRRANNLEVIKGLLPIIKQNFLRSITGSLVLFPLFWSLLKKRSIYTGKIKQEKDEFPDMPKDYYYHQNLNDRRMSVISRYMLRGFDVNSVRKRRRDNFKRYLKLLPEDSLVVPLFSELPDDVCPLYFPVIVDRCREVCRELNLLSICAINWWHMFHRDLPWAKFPDACFLKRKLLALPVHPQLTHRHIDYIANHLLAIVRNHG